LMTVELNRAPPGFNNTVKARSDTDFTNLTHTCMVQAYATRNIAQMFACWSTATAFDNFPKSADFASKCIFVFVFVLYCIVLVASRYSA
jgi:hypothetical protein